MKTIRSLQRGVQVIRALQESPAVALAELHQATGLPKATLLRVLITLEKEGLVWRSVGDELYRYRAIAISPGWYRNQRLAEVAAPILTALQRKTLWPSDLVVRRGHFMELVETSRGLTGLAISRDRLGERIDMAGTAVGRAYLAHCPDDERERIVDYLERHPAVRGPLGPIDRRQLDQAIQHARRRGFAARDTRLPRPLAHLGQAEDNLDAIAVPVASAGILLGALNLVWLRRFNLREQMIRKHLGDLQQVAAGIGRAMRPSRGAGARTRKG